MNRLGLALLVAGLGGCPFPRDNPCDLGDDGGVSSQAYMEGVAFSVVAVGVDDDVDLSPMNNGNGRAEAGETVGLSVTLRAAGLCGVDDIAGRLGVSVSTGAGCVETYPFGHYERFRESHSFGDVRAGGTVTNARSDSLLVPLRADPAGTGECREAQVGLTLLLGDGRHEWSVPLVLPVY